ncbi:MAG: hypothetical protein JW934_20785, partial [Anaerolineae bacterium]|nr:hypothetical protein [Anaerolineae bacterium]
DHGQRRLIVAGLTGLPSQRQEACLRSSRNEMTMPYHMNIDALDAGDRYGRPVAWRGGAV